MSDYEADRQSKFNAGVALAERIHGLQEAINAGKFNPLQFNPMTNTYNYQVMVVAAECLFAEAWGKLSPTERTEGIRVRTSIRSFIKYFPPIKFDKDGKTTLHVRNYEVLIRYMDIFEQLCKDLLESHSLNSPNIDSYSGL